MILTFISRYAAKVSRFLSRIRPLERLQRFFAWMLAPRKLIWRIPLTGIALFVVFSVLSRILTMGAATETHDALREVSLLSLSENGGSLEPLQIVGEVSSLEKADLRAEAGGRVTGVYKKIGDRVGAGEIIAQFDNARERASLLQGEGALEGAKAALDRTLNGSRTETLDILTSSDQNAKTALAATRESVVNSLKAIYGTNEDAIRTKVDTLFSNPRTNAPKFILNTSDSRLVSAIEATRPTIEAILVREATHRDTLTATDDLQSELTRALDESRTLLSFIDDVGSAVARSIPSTNQSDATIAGFSGTISSARGIVSGNLQSISGVSQDLSGKTTAAKIAEANLSQGVTPAREEDVLQARAGFKQAQGAYALTLAALEKTIIRSPITGVLDSLNLTTGAYVAPGTPVASVSNPSGIEIIASVTEDDAPYLEVGTPIAIQNGLAGKLTRVAPGLDPLTKKVGIRIAVEDPTHVLENGSTVSLSIPRTGIAPKAGIVREESLPITAVKLYPDRSVIFTVTDSSSTPTLVEHTVELGPLLGDRVTITNGLDGLTEVVKDARGLRTGMVVTVKK